MNALIIPKKEQKKPAQPKIEQIAGPSCECDMCKAIDWESLKTPPPKYFDNEAQKLGLMPLDWTKYMILGVECEPLPLPTLNIMFQNTTSSPVVHTTVSTQGIAA